MVLALLGISLDQLKERGLTYDVGINLRFSSIVLISSSIIAGCATSQTLVESEPTGSDLFIFVPGQAARKVGQTPYTFSEKDISDRNSPVQVLVSKDGFQSSSVILPPATSGRVGKMSFKLDQVTLPPECQSQNESLNKVARSVAEAQSLMRSKQYDLAEKIMSELLIAHPGLSIVYDILGNINYLKRDFEKSLVFYKKSKTISPDNTRTVRMIKHIEDIMSGRASVPTNKSEL